VTDPEELARALGAIADALDALGATWAIGGSLASAVHGEPRATNDIDIIARLSEASARQLAVRLGPDFYADPDVMAEGARARSSFNVVDTRSFIKIDVFVPPRGPLGEGQLERRVTLSVIPGLRDLPVLGAEDVVLQKLRWYQAEGRTSDRQWRDIVAVLRTGGDRLRADYLEEVAGTGGLGELLARARRDAAS
jgi:hypothetical protein